MDIGFFSLLYPKLQEINLKLSKQKPRKGYALAGLGKKNITTTTYKRTIQLT